MRRSLRLAPLAALVLLPVAAACPCMDGLPALGHNPLGDPLPERVAPEPGCQATPSDRSAVDGSGRVVVLRDSFDRDPLRDPQWQVLPAGGATDVKWSSGQRALLSGPEKTAAGGPALFSTARADGEEWAAKAWFRLGLKAAGQEDPQGNASWTFRFAVIDGGEGSMRELPGLTVVIAKREGRGYEVTPPGGTPSGMFVADTGRHLLEVRQEAGQLQVILNGTVISQGPAMTASDECVLVGISGPTATSDQPALLDDFQLDTVRNEAAIQLERYGLYRPPQLPVSTEDNLEPCATPRNSCCFIEPVSENYGAYPCSARCNLEEGAYAVDSPRGAVAEKDDVPVLEEALNTTYRILGCKADPVGKSESATLWTSGPGRNEEPLPFEDAIRYTTADTVMYDEQGETRFSCDLIGGRLLLQMEYTDRELEEAGIAVADLRILHWDGIALTPLANGTQARTALGNLTVEAAGTDFANRTAWAVIRLTDNPSGRELNNNFATAKRSDGAVIANGYVLGVDPSASTPGPGILLALALIGAAALAMRRGSSPGRRT